MHIHILLLFKHVQYIGILRYVEIFFLSIFEENVTNFPVNFGCTDFGVEIKEKTSEKFDGVDLLSFKISGHILRLQ